MEGTLCKWTNYWNGWQPRWFVLDEGVLTYYKSHGEVNQGCKGSVKIAACEIIPNHVDSKRFDIIIPSEQHYFLRANTEPERQQWLVALGSVKQAVFSTQTSTSIQKATASDALQNALKLKKSELRMYCDLLMQKVHTIKTTSDPGERSEAAETLDSTCDLFIKYLDECMRIADRSVDEESKEVRPPLKDFDSHNAVTGMVGGGLEKHKRTLSSSSASNRFILETIPADSKPAEIHMACPSKQSDPRTPDVNSNDEELDDGTDDADPSNGNDTPDVLTFFTMMAHSFETLSLENNNVVVVDFLDCCKSILPVFDVLGSTAFAPVKMDIQGNIDKLEKHKTETGCVYLFDLLKREIQANSTNARGSATDALLWLKRAMAFICIFLREACQPGEIDLTLCASQAYSESLKRHHNFVVKGVFAVALRAMPYYSTFIKVLAPSPEIANHPAYEETLKRHGLRYTSHLQKIVTMIDTFYLRNNLVSPDNL